MTHASVKRQIKDQPVKVSTVILFLIVLSDQIKQYVRKISTDFLQRKYYMRIHIMRLETVCVCTNFKGCIFVNMNIGKQAYMDVYQVVIMYVGVLIRSKGAVNRMKLFRNG